MLPARESSGNWGFFGYEGAMIDRAIHNDLLDDLQECVQRGFVDRDCYVMGATSVVDLCRKKKAVKCEAWLLEQGWE